MLAMELLSTTGTQLIGSIVHESNLILFIYSTTRMITSKYTCGLQLVESWVNNPTTVTPSHPCLSDIASIDFTGKVCFHLNNNNNIYRRNNHR